MENYVFSIVANPKSLVMTLAFPQNLNFFPKMREKRGGYVINDNFADSETLNSDERLSLRNVFKLLY